MRKSSLIDTCETMGMPIENKDCSFDLCVLSTAKYLATIVMFQDYSLRALTGNREKWTVLSIAEQVFRF